KVPGTIEGLDAVRKLTAAGINVNVTLLFSVERYTAFADAYADGLELRLATRQPIDNIASVASFFLSRIDTLVDKRLDAVNTPLAHELKGEAAIACARLAYRRYKAIIDSERWSQLEAQGARRQRLLWASTSTKNPAYSDTKYVEPLIGPETITTLPPETLSAYRDHGDPACRVNDDPEYAYEVIDHLRSLGIYMHDIAVELEAEGLKKFIDPYDATLAALGAHARQLASA